ncbi:MAG: DNA ligase D [Myxococcota bacterium]|nr:DNA ligase D [Myxococcota bacterium]
MSDLRLYRQKRRPGETPEPMGALSEDEARARGPRATPPGAVRSFCVQQHAARHLHWDLRLEIGEVLVSWAVPRGPSLDPAEKRLAVRTEDHPLEYGDFEGVIPEGNYGAGAMILWDRGTYRTLDGEAPELGLDSGKLDLLLFGHKLRGRFALVRTHRGEGRDWLLLRKGDAPGPGPELVDAQPHSVLSGLTVEELATGQRPAAIRKSVVAAAKRAGATAAPVDASALRPMLAKREERPFSKRGWWFEVKVDGVRVLCERDGARVRIFARTGADRTAVYPEVARALLHLPLERFVIDGEIAVPDDSGRPSFERIQRRFTQTDPDEMRRVAAELPAWLFAFDVLEVAGHDLRKLPHDKRRRILERFVPATGFVRRVDALPADGLALYETVQELGLEGIVAKRQDSPYEAGRRSDRWKKIKVPRTASLAIVGWLPGQGSRSALGSLLLAWRTEAGFAHAGAVGSGLSESVIASLLPELEAREVQEPPFETPLERLPDGARFAAPQLVCEVRFTEVTRSGMLRHPVFLGVRDDVTAAECAAPERAGGALPTSLESHAAAAATAAQAAEQTPADFVPTRRDKVFWPEEGFTKGDLLDYYRDAWPFIAPYLRDRPLVLTRYPDGVEGKSFFQQNAPDFTPAWATRRHIDGTDFFLCNDVETLLYVINSGAIPLHVWSSRLGSLDRPDWLVLDLDPKQAPFEHVVRVARRLHALLDELGAEHFVKTSGQDGLHVIVPLGATLDHTETRTLAELLARVVVSELPDIATVTRPVAARGDRVYVDFGQNGRGRLIASAFSVRPRPLAPVSTPLRWSQVTRRLDPRRFNLKTTLGLMRRDGDPMRSVLETAVDVGSLLDGLAARLEPAEDEG